MKINVQRATVPTSVYPGNLYIQQCKPVFMCFSSTAGSTKPCTISVYVVQHSLSLIIIITHAQFSTVIIPSASDQLY